MGLSNSKQISHNDETHLTENEKLFKEIKQIEEWTGMKVGNIIFDSDVDNWNIGTMEFHKKIINKSNLLFLIEDENSNLFGGYLNAKINKIEGYINDFESFVFSLKSNGRLNGMLKFDIKEFGYAFSLDNHLGPFLFLFGIDICILKENMKHQSYCNQKPCKYNRIKNALCGKLWPKNLTPNRITVIQLI